MSAHVNRKFRRKLVAEIKRRIIEDGDLLMESVKAEQIGAAAGLSQFQTVLHFCRLRGIVWEGQLSFPREEAPREWIVYFDILAMQRRRMLSTPLQQ